MSTHEYSWVLSGFSWVLSGYSDCAFWGSQGFSDRHPPSAFDETDTTGFFKHMLDPDTKNQQSNLAGWMKKTLNAAGLERAQKDSITKGS